MAFDIAGLFPQYRRLRFLLIPNSIKYIIALGTTCAAPLACRACGSRPYTQNAEEHWVDLNACFQANRIRDYSGRALVSPLVGLEGLSLKPHNSGYVKDVHQ